MVILKLKHISCDKAAEDSVCVYVYTHTYTHIHTHTKDLGMFKREEQGSWGGAFGMLLKFDADK